MKKKLNFTHTKRIKDSTSPYMQSRTHIGVALLATLASLAVLPASWAVQTCTQKFSGLQTCTLFNDQFASGGPTSLEATKRIDGELFE